MAHARIQSEIEAIDKEPLKDVTVMIKGSDTTRWRATILGPVETPYEGGTFSLKLYFPENYPGSPPMVTFKTRIFHPNVDNEGAAYLDILKTQYWTPETTVRTVLQSIQSMMIDVNPDTPGNPQALLLYRTNLDKFFHHAEKWTKKYAMQNNVIQQIRNTLSLAINKNNK